jgi:hypothetical protein
VPKKENREKIAEEEVKKTMRAGDTANTNETKLERNFRRI